MAKYKMRAFERGSTTSALESINEIWKGTELSENNEITLYADSSRNKEKGYSKCKLIKLENDLYAISIERTKKKNEKILTNSEQNHLIINTLNLNSNNVTQEVRHEFFFIYLKEDKILTLDLGRGDRYFKHNKRLIENFGIFVVLNSINQDGFKKIKIKDVDTNLTKEISSASSDATQKEFDIDEISDTYNQIIGKEVVRDKKTNKVKIVKRTNEQLLRSILGGRHLEFNSNELNSKEAIKEHLEFYWKKYEEINSGNFNKNTPAEIKKLITEIKNKNMPRKDREDIKKTLFKEYKKSNFIDQYNILMHFEDDSLEHLENHFNFWLGTDENVGGLISGQEILNWEVWKRKINDIETSIKRKITKEEFWEDIYVLEQESKSVYKIIDIMSFSFDISKINEKYAEKHNKNTMFAKQGENWIKYNDGILDKTRAIWDEIYRNYCINVTEDFESKDNEESNITNEADEPTKHFKLGEGLEDFVIKDESEDGYIFRSSKDHPHLISLDKNLLKGQGEQKFERSKIELADVWDMQNKAIIHVKNINSAQALSYICDQAVTSFEIMKRMQKQEGRDGSILSLLERAFLFKPNTDKKTADISKQYTEAKKQLFRKEMEWNKDWKMHDFINEKYDELKKCKIFLLIFALNKTSFESKKLEYFNGLMTIRNKAKRFNQKGIQLKIKLVKNYEK